jgi:hypothetical protein
MHVRNSEMKSSVSFFFFLREKLSGSLAEQGKEQRMDDAGCLFVTLTVPGVDWLTKDLTCGPYGPGPTARNEPRVA